MAQKRMFDKAIIDTDRFMDLSMSAKALYFLLGMEADDEGFVSYKKVMRIHGGNEDDLKILIAKQFLLHFPSGVVVVTDWNTNNYLDKNRIRPTEYQKEKEAIGLTTGGKYVFNHGSTSIEESSIEQYRITSVAKAPQDEKPPKKNTEYVVVFELWGEYPRNWKMNRTQIQAAQNLLEEHGLEGVAKALSFAAKFVDDPFCPSVATPYDLDSKWVKLLAYKQKHS